MLGQRIDGKYELIKVLGQGAMGVVYRARHGATGREVALKLVQPDRLGAPGTNGASAALERFQREARAMGAVADSQHVVQVLDAGTDRDSGAAFMVMELLNGEDVEALVHRLGALPVDLALRIATQALSGLGPAHEAGIVHRDIKPSNLFLSKRADGERIVKVLDFGIVKMLDTASGPQAQGAAAPSKLTRTGGTLGSPAYMSPEQVQASRQLDTRTDLWSMGVVLYQLLCGALPFQELTELPQLLLAIYYRDPPHVAQRAPWVPPEVDAIVHRAMQRDLTVRYATAGEMREAIVRVLGGATSITEGMLVASPAQVRSAQAPVSAMAVAVSGPVPEAGGTTRISGFSPPASVASVAAAKAATAGGTGDTMPLSALPISAAPPTVTPSLVAPATLAVGAPSAAPNAAATSSAAATLASAGAAPGLTTGRTIALAVVGLLLASGLGAAAFAMIAQTDAPPFGASGAEPAPSPPPDAATNAIPSASTPIVVEPRPAEGADAGAAAPHAAPGSSPAVVSEPAPGEGADAGPAVLPTNGSVAVPAKPAPPATAPTKAHATAASSQATSPKPPKVKTID